MNSAVVMGALKAVWQIAFSWDKDKTFTQGVQFWGLYVTFRIHTPFTAQSLC
jgi:hypothetical protein